ncbi:MAG: hypothetical protein KKE82_04270, partial [Proteobacteria bacterium]|nr:hypothetical protein [Pseudomonadota bacterium]
RAKPEFFRVPPSARSKGSPQGQDWLGCLFLVSSFGHAKEERENRRKVIAIFPGISGGTKKGQLINGGKEILRNPGRASAWHLR